MFKNEFEKRRNQLSLDKELTPIHDLRVNL